MQEAVSQSLYSYWDALRGNRPAPKRFEIEPSRIANNLPDTFILERVNYTNARFRLAGTRITDALGMELRGKNLFEMFDIGDRRTLQNQMELIASRCAVGLFHMSAESADGKSTTFEVLILPLTHTSDTVERFLGSVASREKPEWLGSVPLTRRKLVHHEIVWPSRTASEDENDFQYQAPILHTRREARIVRSARRQFRVFDGGLSFSGDER
jgi:hypothetical protein